MAESILLINTMRIERGKLEDFKVSVKNSLAFVQENGPQLLVEVYGDEEKLAILQLPVIRRLGVYPDPLADV